jgi:hypothetical protein
MTRPQLNIKLDGEREKDLLEAVKSRAQDERISLKEFVLDALRKRLASPLPTQASQSTPLVNKGEIDGLKRRIANSELAMRGEIKKDRELLAVLAQAIALIESRLDAIDNRSPVTLTVNDNDEPTVKTKATMQEWNSEAIDFLSMVQWSDADG